MKSVLFDADIGFISQLDSVTLVKLMRGLLYAECAQTGIPLRSASVPIQITVADGGEDGRAEWAGGVPSTDYLPARFTVFQSKAQSLTESVLKGEILKKTAATKAGTAKGAPAKLNAAIVDALAKRGAYIVFCSQPMTGKKKDKLATAIKDAIREGGGDPSKLSAIEIYDANQIAAWVNAHPAIAVWLASMQAGRSLSGFLAFDGWARNPTITRVPWSPSDAPRYWPVNREVPVAVRIDKTLPAWSFEQAVSGVRDHLNEPQKVVRVFGPSGFGKSRFVYECFAQGLGVAGGCDQASLIYADYAIVGDDVLKVALQITDSRDAGVLVVDECPDAIHNKLAEIAGRTGSQLRIVTVNIETKTQQAAKTLAIRLEKAPDDLIGDIAAAVAPTISDETKGFVKKLADGFPRMAVLAAQQSFDRRLAIASVDQVLDRILWGTGAANSEAQRCLEAVCLFEWVGIAGEPRVEAAFIAEKLLGLTPDVFIEHVKSFTPRGILLSRGDYVQIAPIPLAVRLGEQRLAAMADGRLFTFFEESPARLRTMLLRRLRWLDTSPAAQAFADTLLSPDNFGSLAALNTEFGSECLDRLVHVAPDRAMETIDRIFGSLTVDQLRALTSGRRHLVWALEKLVFRRQTFDPAATLLRRLATAENEDQIANNASGIFKQLFQLYLGGTEAGPEDRLRILDDGLVSTYPAERALCVDALGHMLDTRHFSRGGGAEEIGSGEPLKDWQPQYTSEIDAFYRAAVTRLTSLATGDDPLAKTATNHLASSIRGLVRVLPFTDVKVMVDAVTARRGFWRDAARGLNGWLYFDRKGAPKALAKEVRAYYDSLLPTDTVGLAEFFSSGWPVDLHNPDRDYDRDEKSGLDFDYAARKAAEYAPVIAFDVALRQEAFERLACGDGNSLFGFAKTLAGHLADPHAAFTAALTVADRNERPPNRNFFAGLISGVDERDPALARACLRTALTSDTLKASAIGLVGSGRLQPEDLRLVIDLLKSGDIKPWQCGQLSYGRGLDHLALEDFSALLDALTEDGSQGLWAALEILEMTVHGGRALDAEVTARLKTIVIARDLFTDVKRQTMDAYHWKEAALRLIKTGQVDMSFAQALTKQILSLGERSKSDVFHEMDNAAREVLGALLGVQPKAVWHKLKKAVSHKDAFFRHRIDRLLEPAGDDRLAAGVLFALPADTYLAWVRKKPAERARYAAGWLPVTVHTPDGQLAWHPSFATFIDEFGSVDDVLGVLAGRLYPRSWWGSLGPVLEPYVALLRTWLNHPRANVRAWARARIGILQAEIAAANKRSEEDVVRYG